MEELNLEGEIWKEIPGFNQYYQVSNIGRIKTMFRMVNGKNGALRPRPEKIMKPKLTMFGYRTISLFNPSKKKVDIFVHRLVAQAFIPNPENKTQVNHIDGNKQNNHVDNLEWNTASENTIHAHKNNLVKVRRGEGVHGAKLTEDKIKEIREMYAKGGISYVKMAELFDVGPQTLHAIVQRKLWKHI